MRCKLLFLSVCIYHFCGAQKVNQCGIIVPPKSLQTNFASVYEAENYVNTMLDSINWKQNFQLQEQNGINNAYATIIRNRRYIIYDNDFLENLDSYAQTKWASVSVLAHEMGHHYRNHVVDRSGSTPLKEIEADYFSGYVMAKLGADLAEAKAAMERIASPNASASHPAKAERLRAITNGWNYARGFNNTNSGSSGTVLQPQQNTPLPSADPSWIYLSLYGNNEMSVYLSDDKKNFTAAPLNTAQPFVFKFEIYNYGWLRFSNNRAAKTYTLLHGKDYAIIWSRRTNNWTVVEVP